METCLPSPARKLHNTICDREEARPTPSDNQAGMSYAVHGTIKGDRWRFVGEEDATGSYGPFGRPDQWYAVRLRKAARATPTC